MGKETISSQELADYTHVNSTQIRRDLSGFGKFGKRGVGYNVESLVTQIRKILRTSGSTTSRCSAPATSARRSPRRTSSPTTASASWRCSTSTASKVGSEIGDAGGAPHSTRCARSSRRRTSSSAVLAVPTVGRPGRSPTSSPTPGVKIIFNYSDALLQVPPEVTVHTSSPAVDLLYALYFYLT